MIIQSRKDYFNFQISAQTKFQAVFIDTHYNEEDWHEEEAFKENTDKLWKFAQEAKGHPFECKDIKAALTEIQYLEEKYANLTLEMKELEGNRFVEKFET